MRSISILTDFAASQPLEVRLHSVAEACAVLGIKRTQFYKLVSQGQLTAVKLGRRTLVRSDELQRFINGLAASPTRMRRARVVEAAQ